MVTPALTELRLSGFRSYPALRLTLEARPVALYGPNGAGKTNILEAVSLLSPGRGLRRAGVDQISRRPDAPGWKVAAVLEAPASLHEVETWSADGSPRQTRIDGKAAPQLAIARLARILWLVPSMDRLWIEGAEGRRRFLDRVTMSFVPDHAEAALIYEKAMRERNRLLRENVHDPAWYTALESRMAEAGETITANRRAALARLAAAQAEGRTTFPMAEMTLLGPEGRGFPETAHDLAAVLAEGRGRDLAAGRTLTGPHRADLGATYTAKGVAARDASTGEQKALLVALVLANARALKAATGAAPILLLDEIAAHLDAERRAALYEEITALGAQAWMTGTAAELFVASGNRLQYLEVSERDGTSAVTERPTD